MGLRVRVVLVVLSLLAIAALAVPLALSLADRRTATLAAERGRQLAALADSAAMPDSPLADVWWTATTRCTAKVCSSSTPTAEPWPHVDSATRNPTSRRR